MPGSDVRPRRATAIQDICRANRGIRWRDRIPRRNRETACLSTVILVVRANHFRTREEELGSRALLMQYSFAIGAFTYSLSLLLIGYFI